MYYEWHTKYLNKENSLFLTTLNYFRQILVAFKYFVQSDWRIIVKNMELPYNVKLKTQVLLNLQFSVDHCLSFCPFSFGHCIALPSLLRFMTSDNPSLASTNFSYLLTYTRTAMLSQLSNFFIVIYM